MTVINGSQFMPPVEGGAPAAPPSQEMGQEQFLQLLMTQMGNQDPLNPMKTEEFMNQITAMNSLQQQIATNSRLDELVLAMGALNNETAVNLVGKTVVAEGNAFPHEVGASEELRYSLPEQADSVTVTVRDESGTVVATLTQDDVKAGENTIGWDGTWVPSRGPEYEPDVAAGEYTFQVAALNADGETIPATTYVSGVVDELRFDTGAPQVVVGGQTLDLAAITRVLGGGEPPVVDQVRAGVAALQTLVSYGAPPDPSSDPPTPPKT